MKLYLEDIIMIVYTNAIVLSFSLKIKSLSGTKKDTKQKKFSNFCTERIVSRLYAKENIIIQLFGNEHDLRQQRP